MKVSRFIKSLVANALATGLAFAIGYALGKWVDEGVFHPFSILMAFMATTVTSFVGFWLVYKGIGYLPMSRAQNV
jgi:ABC-type arginine/histidine transport system permease subunit